MKLSLSNVTVGEILLEDFLKPMGISQYKLAKDIGVPPRRINEIVHGQRAITVDTALRLGRYFDQTPQFWLGLQMECDLRNANTLAKRLKREISPLKMIQRAKTPPRFKTPVTFPQILS